MANKIVIGIFIFLLIGFILIFRPVPIVKEKNALVQKGIVVFIREGGVHDIVIGLKDVNKTFYINRGMEQGLNIDSLRKKLYGQMVTLKYPRYWTPLDWNDRIKHISKLEFGKEILFNELK